ncbi:carbohydrate ABC transporter permease [Cohnella lupini]|uniref:Raffinose/stachyose/melibiose transport system permease protein n=1 Tax=Cohnella lupini TaxID=1294267 RepID=A0A3D9IJY3_9BACL|nr:carbohydrate ABC transporter permease [Cohnella lupini]RED61829.1 raffinose/stachyose/melibiose transport system permease protein [Cohnella lupini]
MSGSRTKSRLVVEIALWCSTLLILIPLYFVIVNSLKSATEVQMMTAKLPAVFHFNNYVEVLKKANVPRAFMNSAIFSISSIVVCAVLSSMASYILVRRNTRINGMIFNLFLVGMIAPMNMVTTFKLMKTLHLINSYYGIILLYAASFIPFTIFLYNSFIRNLPTDLDEAGVIDGAGPLRRYISILFPLLKPVTATAMVINFVGCWNDFVFPLYFVTESSKWGVILLLYQFIGAYYSRHDLLFAGATMIALPTLIVYLLGQKYIISGMTAGAIKG